ncbi:MAG: glycosyltransferase [Mycobacteriales bacterium]|nr:glycosyltransferase [Frankia sp.]
MSPPGTSYDVVVLLGTSWEVLRDRGTRWRSVLVRWLDDRRVASLTAVDYPKFSRRAMMRPTRRLVSSAASWKQDIRLWHASVPAFAHRSPADRLAWGRVARALDGVLPAPARRVVIAATPLWMPALLRLPAERRGFDAVDDWRGLPATARYRSHVDAGYQLMSHADSLTAVSGVLAARLSRDYGVREPVVIGNGVDLSLYAQDVASTLTLPDRSFAVYVGVIEERVDLDLVAQVVRALPEMPVVVAGPAAPRYGEALRRTGASWLGAVSPADVPALLQHAAVGLVPHRVNDFTASMDPLKVLEYLAARLPVVATPVPGVAVSNRVVVAEPRDFAAAVAAAARHGRYRDPDPRLRARDWDAVAARLLNVHLPPGVDERGGLRGRDRRAAPG